MVADQPEGKADQDRPKVVSHGRYVAFQMADVAIPCVDVYGFIRPKAKAPSGVRRSV